MPTASARLGMMGEKAARCYLESKGYQVVCTNYRCRWGEIDIVAQQEDDTLVFAEVRTRRHLIYGTAQESLSKGKIGRLIATADTYLQALPQLPGQWRIDLIGALVDPDWAIQEINHLPSAIEAD